MLPRVSLVNGGIFDFTEMRGFSPFGLYCHEMVQSVRHSVSRSFVNSVRIIERYFAVLRRLQNIPIKLLRFLSVLVVHKMGTTTLSA